VTRRPPRHSPVFLFADIPQIISNEVRELKVTKKISHNLTRAVNDLVKIKDKKTSNHLFCQTCDLVIRQIIAYRRSGANKESMVAFFRKLCRTFATWGGVACDGYINIEIVSRKNGKFAF
jgi:hypothetical protein